MPLFRLHVLLPILFFSIFFVYSNFTKEKKFCPRKWREGYERDVTFLAACPPSYIVYSDFTKDKKNSLVWMFCGEKLNRKLNQLNRKLSKDYNSSSKDLLDRRVARNF